MTALKATKNCFTALLLLLLIQGCLSDEKTKKPPKIVTKDGNLVLKAGEDGDIVLEPDDGRQVRIGSFVLSKNSTTTTVQGQKGQKGDLGARGQSGIKGDIGSKGARGDQGGNGPKGDKGDPGQRGLVGSKGNPGEKGSRGDQGAKGARGPKGPKGDTFNMTAGKDCNLPSDYGHMSYMNDSVQVCTPEGWKKLAFQSDICTRPTVPKTNLNHFKRSGFGVLFQFNGDMKIDFSPNTTSAQSNVTTVYQNPVSPNSNPGFVDAVMGKALRLTGRQHVDLNGLPVDFWSSEGWSVMALVKLNKQGLNNVQEIPVISSGTRQNNKGLHLGIKHQMIIFGFYSNDLRGSKTLEYDRWYEITWTWQKTQGSSPRERKIYVNGVLDSKDENVVPFQGDSLKTKIGAWWDDTNRNNNIQIDTLYIIDSVVDYSKNDDSLVICQGKALANEMP